MTRKEIEARMLDIGREIKAMLAGYNPNANHFDLVLIDGVIMANAGEYDAENDCVVEPNIIDAIVFADGGMKLDGQYYSAEEVKTMEATA